MWTSSDKHSAPGASDPAFECGIITCGAMKDSLLSTVKEIVSRLNNSLL